jgi:hypothetical protein
MELTKLLGNCVCRAEDKWQMANPPLGLDCNVGGSGKVFQALSDVVCFH